jgi:hypothetical protein
MSATTLSASQTRVLASARKLCSMPPIVFNDGSTMANQLLVSGRDYKTAESLVRRGLGALRYQGRAQGWFIPTTTEEV